VPDSSSSSSSSSTPQPEPSVGQQQVAVTDTTLRQKSQELGLLGKLFGGRDHAPVNIAGSIIILGLMALICLPFLPESKTLTQADLAKIISALILAAFTFLGGYLSGSTKQN
jgi:hypothetical protein